MSEMEKRSRAQRRWLLCDCEGTQQIDGAAVTAALGDAVDPATAAVGCALCTRESGLAAEVMRRAAAEGAPVGVACAQEAPVFLDMAEEIGTPAPIIADIRDRAGWTKSGADAAHLAAKTAALLAEAALPTPSPKTLGVVSDGLCLIVGRAAVVLPAAAQLSTRLSVTALLTDESDGDALGSDLSLSARPGETGFGAAADGAGFDVAFGRIARAAGALGGFELVVDGYAERAPGGRGGLRRGAARDGAQTECDIIVDLTGDAALFPASEKRDGYLRAEPGDPLRVARALFDASDLSGDFDKTLHISFTAELCAHSRARQPGCERCLSVCPTGAITVPNEGKSDHVAIDPSICAGCGACAAVCPSGAAAYDAPPFEHHTLRLRTLAQTWFSALASQKGGDPTLGPRLLIHDAEHGAEMIRLAARWGDGLPADVIPLELEHVTEAGHALMLAALGLGFRSVSLLAGPKTDLDALEGQTGLCRRLLAGCDLAPTRVSVITPAEPDALSQILFDPAKTAASLDRPRILALGAPRTVARQALGALAPAETSIDLAPPSDADVAWPIGGAPYGAVLVATDKCTLCLSCVSLCPSGALADNPDAPELRFQEDACLQCGICANACPEDAIAYEPRFNTNPSALAFDTLHREEPFACISCGKEFGVKSTIERIAEKLGGQHWMYTDSDNLKLLQMCEDCRVQAQFHGDNSPFKMGAPRSVRTTDDYLAERAAAGSKPKSDA